MEGQYLHLRVWNAILLLEKLSPIFNSRTSGPRPSFSAIKLNLLTKLLMELHYHNTKHNVGRENEYDSTTLGNNNSTQRDLTNVKVRRACWMILLHQTS